MAEYIEREAVLKAVLQYSNDVSKQELFMLTDLLVDITDIPTADVQPTNQWISVEDRLPKDNSMVLCYCRTTTGAGNLYMFGSRLSSVWFLKTTSELHTSYPNPQIQVLYWQPLPEPPSESTKG